jgi:hypothetical protein
MNREPIGDRRLLQRLPGGGHAYVFLDEGVRIEARYLRRDSYGQMYAELNVQADWHGAARHKGSLSCAHQNLSSQTARRTLATYCRERAKTKPQDFDWPGAIDAACIEIINADRAGDPVIVLDDAPAVVTRDYDVCGLQVPADARSMFIAHGDSLKSLLTLQILGELAGRGITTLYADWEWSADRHRARKNRLFGAGRLDRLHYLRCHAPLVVEADRIRRHCDEYQVEFMGVDSVGLASDGPLKDDDVAIRFHRALDTLPPALCAAHVPKSSIGPDAKVDVSAFGSVFFSNLCRMCWAVRKQAGASNDVVSVGLFATKQNDGARVRPVGLEFTFTADRIAVRNVDLATVDGLADKLPLATRMIHALKRGPMTYAALAEELGAKIDSVIKASNRSEAFTRVSGENGVYRLALVERRIA